MSSRMGPRGAFLGAGQQQYQPAPNAALLIDFDNVTMSIRSDLGKEIKALLKSDVIRGKVAVQRAYADWRRYPQYIVPLTESSVDLIFAPAYGSSKKNATDLRMAIDAIELVFTRPEIGTFILMTGDSDFSSCVLKLKEYGKYVIGVGMRESSSDLLIQNCDEYYSYHSISGLSRAGEVEESKEDPWTLVRRAVQQMVRNGDVMRTDRLKQVMLELDPGFDEKKIGYSKFSRFVSEAASKGIIHLRKAENGQYEILPEGAAEPEPREKVVQRIVAEAEAQGNGRRRRGGRGREERPREPRVTEEEPGAVEAAAETEGPTGAKPEPPAKAAVDEAKAPPREAAPTAESPARQERPEADGGRYVVGDLDQAYALLQEAVRQLAGKDSKAVRDGDVKRRMIELSRGFDEAELGYSKFTRFLRQAHDAEVIDLNRVGAGNYEVSLPANGRKLGPPPRVEAGPASAEPAAAKPTEAVAERAPAAPTEQPAARTPSVAALRGRRSGRAAPSGPPPILPGQVVPSPTRGEAVAEAAKAEPAAPEAAGVAAAGEEGAPAEAAPKSRSRRGRRGRGRAAAMAVEADAEPTAEPAAEQPEAPAAGEKEQPARKKASTRTRKPAAEAATASEPAVGEGAPVARSTRSGRGRRGAATAEESPPALLEGQVVTAVTGDGAKTPAKSSRRGPARKAEPAKVASAPSPAALGLPQTPSEIAAYLSSYRGIGAKTAETLIDRFGADVFDVLRDRPDEVRAVLSERLSKTLLEQWSADYERRTAAAAGTPATDDAGSDSATGASGGSSSGTGARRGGRSRTRARGKAKS